MSEARPTNDSNASSDSTSDIASDSNGSSDNDDSSESSASNDKVSIPDDFPKDIHVAEGAKSAEFVQAGGKGNLVLMYSATDEEQFVKTYLEAMVAEGWTQVTSSKLPIGTLTNFKKDDRKVTISISPPKEEMIKVAIIVDNKE